MPLEHRVDLSEVHALIERKQYAEARLLLEELARRHPNRPEILAELLELCVELADAPGFQRAAERLLSFQKDDPDLLLGLAGSYLDTVHPALALTTLRRFLSRWPDHGEATEARRVVASLESGLPALLAEVGLSGDHALELAVMHEQAQTLLEAGDYAEAQRVLDRLLRQQPDFVPGLNNLSQLHAVEGRSAEAIKVAERALTLDPANYHALSNLTRYYCLSGHLEEANEFAARVKVMTGPRPDVWSKKAEALSYLGDDAGVVEAFRGAEKAGALKGAKAEPLLYHLAAVAALRSGRQDEARRRWQRALKLAPGLQVAQDNLDELKKPVGERHGPWAFSLGQWLSQQAWRDLAAATASLGSRRGDAAAARALKGFLLRHPEVPKLAPLLLDRGDPAGREFAFRLALLVKTPELLTALRDFALGQRGPDALREEAAIVARTAGLLPPGLVRLWLQGEWREVIPLSFEITDEPSVQHGPRVERLGEEALKALRAGEGERAEQILQEALQLEPDKPDLLNNLAVAYNVQGRAEEMERLLHRIHERHPDYVFASIGLANIHIRRKELDAAAALLDPLLDRPRFHSSELAMLCEAQVTLREAQSQIDAAQTWLDLWASVDPDHPKLDQWRLLLRLRGGFNGLFGRRRRR